MVLSVLLLGLLSWVQVFLVPQDKPTEGEWFLFGTDTVSHDAIVHLWVRQQHAARPLEIPLWMPELQGGLPTIGAFLWTPLAPQLWPHALLSYPSAQKVAWWLTLWWSGLGALAAARTLALRRGAALFAAVAWMLTGHVVTLIHAGHLQKVMALGWMGWAMAGALLMARHSERPKGAALAGLGIGMMFLSGHPQIAWGAGLCVGLTGIAGLACRRRNWKPMLLSFGIFGVIAGATAGAQFLPGLELNRHGNRAGGVDFAEAAATSYPPKEIFEYILPRFLGSSTPADEGVYRGDWGERIVSDYAGMLVVVLAIFSAADRRRRRWVLLLAALVAMALLMGFGKYTPVYDLLRKILPGFASFRSPGTFFFILSFGVVLLAGIGVNALGSLRRNSGARLLLATSVGASLLLLAMALRDERLVTSGGSAFLATMLRMSPLLVIAVACWLLPTRRAWVAVPLLIAAVAVDLLGANRAFLRAVPWDSYSEWLAPNAMDERLAAMDLHRRFSYPDNDLSLRPILQGMDAINGYHPIGFGAKGARDAELTLHTPEWQRAWGITAEIRRGLAPPDAKEWMAFPDAGMSLRAFEHGPVDFVNLPGDVDYWRTKIMPLRRTANRASIHVETPGGTLILREVQAPGWYLSLEGEAPVPVTTVALDRTVPLDGTFKGDVEWTYRPPAWRIGLFLTASGLALAMLLLVSSRRRTCS